MGWTAPRTWVVGEIETAAIFNPHIRDNLLYLKGNAGAVTIEDELLSVVAAGGTLTAQGTNNTSFGRLRLIGKKTSAAAVEWRIMANAISDTGELAFYDVAATAERMRIDNAGFVGIGTAAPQGKLHIARAAAGGMMFLSGTISGTLNTLAVAGTVTVMAIMWGMIRNNGGTSLSFIGLISANTFALGTALVVNCNTASDQVTITVTAGGAVTAQRTAGSNSHELHVTVYYQ